jgi:hypothetical protein
MALITIYLIALYIKSQAFKAFSCYNIILMSVVLFLDCLLKIVPDTLSEDGSYEGWEFIISIIRNFFDKMILSVLSLQVVIVYIGIIHTEFYYSHEKSIFIVGDIACAIVSGALAFIYSSIRWVKNEQGKTIFYEDDKHDKIDNELKEEIRKRSLTKKILEIIFCSVIFIVNVFFLVVVISHISRKRKEAKAGLIEDLGYGKQLLRFSFIFSVNVIAIVVSGVIINFGNDFGLENYSKYSQIVYLVVCFVIDMCFMVNKTVYQETLKIFCKKKYYAINEINEERLKSLATFDEFGIQEEDDYENDN